MVMTSTRVCYRLLFFYKLPHETQHKNQFVLLALMPVVKLKKVDVNLRMRKVRHRECSKRDN